MTEFMNEHRKKAHRLENDCTLEKEERNDVSKVEAQKRDLFTTAASFKLPFDRHDTRHLFVLESAFSDSG